MAVLSIPKDQRIVKPIDKTIKNGNKSTVKPGRKHHRTESPTSVLDIMDVMDGDNALSNSNSDLKKLFAPAFAKTSDDGYDGGAAKGAKGAKVSSSISSVKQPVKLLASHYATYNRLQAQELLKQLDEVRKSGSKSRSSSPVPKLTKLDSIEDEVETPLKSVGSSESISTTATATTTTTAETGKTATSAVSTARAKVAWKPTLRKHTIKQELHRMLLWPKYMLLNCVFAIFEAVSIMIRDLRAHGWKPSKIFESNDPLALSSALNFANGKKAPGYSAQLTFTKKFTDRPRLERALRSLCEEFGMSPENAKNKSIVNWNDEVELLKEYDAKVTDIPGDYYIPNSKSYYAAGGKFKNYHVAIDVFESEETTILQAHLPGRAWDGTSCFNFVKELVHRYYSPQDEWENSPVFKAKDLIQMKQDSREKFDNLYNLFRWAIWVPFNVYSNQSGLCWQKASADAGIDGYKEIPKELSHVNLNPEQSKKLATALKTHATEVGARGAISPTAALVFAGVHAYQMELGELPFTVNMQASLQTRSFEPSFKERRFVGDWLIGILHRVRTWNRKFGLSSYKVDDAQQFYQDLIQGLGDTDAAVRDGFYSRVLGKLKGGAAAFEKTPCFPGNSRLNDSLFFNNYGIRAIHQDSGCVGFNWSGAGKVGINCILINGSICCTVASTQLPLETVEAIRDTFKEILFGMMEGGDGNDVVKKIAQERGL